MFITSSTSTVKEANVLSIVEISGHFSSKIAQEYQLPTASQVGDGVR